MVFFNSYVSIPEEIFILLLGSELLIVSPIYLFKLLYITVPVAKTRLLAPAIFRNFLRFHKEVFILETCCLFSSTELKDLTDDFLVDTFLVVDFLLEEGLD